MALAKQPLADSLPVKPINFKIYPYTGSGVSIDYKTDGVVQQVSAVAK